MAFGLSTTVGKPASHTGAGFRVKDDSSSTACSGFARAARAETRKLSVSPGFSLDVTVTVAFVVAPGAIETFDEDKLVEMMPVG